MNKESEKEKMIQNTLFNDYSNKIFLTFDVDWADDEILKYTHHILMRENIKSTFFVTHQSAYLETLRSDKNIELGIHPNFNPLLLQADHRTFQQVFEDILTVVPQAECYRSHALTQSSLFLLDEVLSKCVRYDLNMLLPISSGILAKPFMRSGMVMVPHFYEDDVSVVEQIDSSVEKYLNYEGIRVFDFHPTHVFVNTTNWDFYNANARPHFKHIEILRSIRAPQGSHGVEDFLTELISAAKQGGFEFCNIRDIASTE